MERSGSRYGFETLDKDPDLDKNRSDPRNLLNYCYESVGICVVLSFLFSQHSLEREGRTRMLTASPWFFCLGNPTDWYRQFDRQICHAASSLFPPIETACLYGRPMGAVSTLSRPIGDACGCRDQLELHAIHLLCGDLKTIFLIEQKII
jgi:hypothetical protein